MDIYTIECRQEKASDIHNDFVKNIKVKNLMYLFKRYGFVEVDFEGDKHSYHINESIKKIFLSLTYDISTNILSIGCDKEIWKDQGGIVISGIKISTEMDFHWLVRNVIHYGKPLSDHLHRVSKY